ncbi:pentatricopeptide repeat-containing protein At3g61360 [Humulus lupulus]|uniref:pentatricopeptide repeat-containing protein At3g61360 n=1 Tax=Humulus lupulus TaxID=3486 RepID=UPI002B414A1D|nr:pentatricopeptide repeat-containing protein At3g61360 [Humulus lupulus]
MLLMSRLDRCHQVVQNPQKSSFIISSVVRSFSHGEGPPSETKIEINRITAIINDHSFPDQPLQPALLQHIPPPLISNILVENVLGRLFATHSNGLKALEFFDFSLHHSQFSPSTDAFEKILHILVRMRYFDRAWELMKRIRKEHQSLLTLKSMSIMLSKIAKFQSYEDTLAAFGKMENEIFVGRKFGTEEFNVLLRAFCTQRQMKEARSVFLKMHSRFAPDKKSMNILLLGFKESGDTTAVELFYHEMIARGFKPNVVTYNIRIDVYCKTGCLGDGLRLLEEMERSNLSPTLGTITTLIHGAGIARNPIMARKLFDKLPARNLCPDSGAYNALMSSLIRCKDVQAAASLMIEMEEKHIIHDYMTYYTMFFGLIKKKDFEGVFQLYEKMTERKFVPNTRTVVMLMKVYCENSRIDLGMHLWGYLVENGYCPHGHALEILLTGLCSKGLINDAFECSIQVLERGRHLSDAAFRMIERLLMQEGEVDKIRRLTEIIKKLHTHLPPLRDKTIIIPA